MICSAVSNSSGFDRCVKSPVWTSIAGLLGIWLILSSAAFSVPLVSGLASLLKPIWLSLIWTNVKLLVSAARASPPKPRSNPFGTPPDTLQTMPVPAQARHFKRPRRLVPASASSGEEDLLVVMLPLPMVCGAEGGDRKGFAFIRCDRQKI